MNDSGLVQVAFAYRQSGADCGIIVAQADSVDADSFSADGAMFMLYGTKNLIREFG
jgi:hypothetical protein